MDLEHLPSDVGTSTECTTLRVTGFVDISTSEALVGAGLRILWDASDLVLDLSEVDFMDAAGVAALTALSSTAGRLGRTFTITAASFPVRRLLQILELTDAWTMSLPPRTETG